MSLASPALADSSPLCNLGNPDTVLDDALNGKGIQKKEGIYVNAELVQLAV